MNKDLNKPPTLSECTTLALFCDKHLRCSTIYTLSFMNQA